MLSMVMFVLASGLTFYAVTAQHEVAQENVHQLNSDVSAISFLAYREAVVHYNNANPGVTGSIPSTSLQPYYPYGYSNPGTWNNFIDSNRVYVYSSNYLDVSRLNERLHRSLLVGRKTSSGRLISLSGVNTQLVLPAVIPVNAIVIAGS